VVVLGAVGVGIATRSHEPDVVVTNQQIAVPAYIPPETEPDAWNRLIAADSSKVGLVVANVASGPGEAVNVAWSDVLARAHNSGKRVLGYVDTGYMGLSGQTTRQGSTKSADWIAQIQQDINAWYQLYPGMVDGIFFDRVDSTCGADNEHAKLYVTANQFEKRAHPDSVTVLNAGSAVPQCFEDAADVLVTYESDYAGYMVNAEQADDHDYHSLTWTPKDPRKLWHIVYGVAPDQLDAVIATSRDRHAGYVFITDDVLPNPYDTLPGDAYWAREQQSVNGAPAPSLAKVPVPAAS